MERVGGMMMLVLLMAAASFAPSVCGKATPGFEATLTDNGIDYARKVAIPIIQKELQGMTIPDVSGEAHTPVGRVNFELKNIKATSVSLGTSSISTSSSGISGSISNVEVSMSADWHYREHSWPHVSDHGSADVSASSISVSLGLGVGLSNKHEPMVTVNKCSAGIGHLKIKFHGGASWLYNLFSHFIADELKKKINSKVCESIKDAVSNEANKALSTLPEMIQLDDCALINFEFLTAPTTTSKYLLTSHKGEFFQVKHNKTEAPFSAPAIPAPSSASRMFYVAMSAYTIETAGWVYGQCGELDFLIQPGDVPSSWPFSLNTSSIGKVLPQLQKKYPNRPMDIHFDAKAKPLVLDVNKSGGNANLFFLLTAYVITPNNTKISVFSMNVTVKASANAWVTSDRYLHGNLTFLNLQLALVSSEIGHINVNVLDTIIAFFCKDALLPGINKAIAKGLPIPTMDGVEFIHPSIQFEKAYLLIDTDIKYTPSNNAAEDPVLTEFVPPH